eukprot:CAMPEP_0168558860 /NCGR_PEP_ID=MMETSP0413-20121227/10206_1 /TAXON_ID=136452 /ORGANISM="Filamoeba nolandi, Strain NC-AS-23-1" /LENGTH=669 /DNA_ID=CAMNT_0008590031 /DNA_START=120 /DNA_END=2129 /DNA_ORIENTATION=-
MTTLAQKLTQANETTWMRLGALAESLHDPDKAMYSYEGALRQNPYNVKALTQYPKAVEYFQRILAIENNNGEIWGALGHCYLMMDDLQKAYTSYQQALYHLPNPKDPNLWYGIGILYDRYGSFEHAEEAFTAVLKMDPKFEKSNEIYFRLGIIYKQQLKHEEALNCFRFILQKPPRPLTQADIWFQIGHVYELQKDLNNAKEAYERVLKDAPNHAKALQQLGWLYHSNSTAANQDVAITYLMRSIDADPSDGQTWYLLGRCYMAQQQYRKAYDAYQQAVYRDGRNPTFWCSIGVLYYQINQYRDALDAYSRAIRLNPYLSEVWYDLGTLYESCNQISDSLDAYQRAAELDPNNKHIQQRLQALREAQNNPNRIEAMPPQGAAPSETGPNFDKIPPSTMEPRTMTGHSLPVDPQNRAPLSMPMPALNVPPSHQNMPTTVPDIVDLSNDSKARTLPSTNEMRTQPKDLHPGNNIIPNHNDNAIEKLKAFQPLDRPEGGLEKTEASMEVDDSPKPRETTTEAPEPSTSHTEGSSNGVPEKSPVEPQEPTSSNDSKDTHKENSVNQHSNQQSNNPSNNNTEQEAATPETAPPKENVDLTEAPSEPATANHVQAEESDHKDKSSDKESKSNDQDSDNGEDSASDRSSKKRSINNEGTSPSSTSPPKIKEKKRKQ